MATWKYMEYVEDYRALLAGRRDSRYMDYPFLLSFETLTLCNAICDFCPYPFSRFTTVPRAAGSVRNCATAWKYPNAPTARCRYDSHHQC